PKGSVKLDVSWQVWFATPVVATWLLTTELLDAAPTKAIIWLFHHHVVRNRWNDIAGYSDALQLAAWIVDAGLGPFFFGVLAVIAVRDWPDLRELWPL